MADFCTRLNDRIAQHGPLCVGLDPSAATLATCGLPDSAEGAFEFGRRVLAASGGRIAIVKPQAAFFERFGSAGWRALEEVMTLARRAGVLTLLDGKRGDIDTTGEAYAEAFFSPTSPVRADAVTVHAYLGIDALRRFFDFAARNGGGVFVVVRSSNPEGETLQQARLADGTTVALDLCRSISRYNAAHAQTGLGPIGAVVGATCDDAEPTVQALPQSFILAPGVGAQGATFQDVARRMPSARRRVLPSVSRAILMHGGGECEIVRALGRLTEDARAALAD
jgi:orotidine-5'-phosphate decarboxylase